jgi:hypothetical protein
VNKILTGPEHLDAHVVVDPEKAMSPIDLLPNVSPSMQAEEVGTEVTTHRKAQDGSSVSGKEEQSVFVRTNFQRPSRTLDQTFVQSSIFSEAIVY